MPWFLYGLVHNVFDECILYLGNLLRWELRFSWVWELGCDSCIFKPITYKHDLSKDICSWIIESYIYDNFSILMLLLISRT